MVFYGFPMVLSVISQEISQDLPWIFPWIQAKIRKEAQKRAKEDSHSERPLVFLDIEVSKRGILGAWDFKKCHFSGDFSGDFCYFSKGTLKGS
jgi:hypothetical protein